MRKLTIMAVSLLLTFNSCTTSSSSSTSATPSASDSSTFTLSFNGKTYHGAQGLALNSSGAVTAYLPATGVQMAAQTSVTSTGAVCVISSTVLNNYIFSLQVQARGGTTAIGSDTSITGTTAYTFTDMAAGNVIYTIGDNSTVNVTESDAHWVAGTMNLNLSLSGTPYTATGSFKIYH